MVLVSKGKDTNDSFTMYQFIIFSLANIEKSKRLYAFPWELPFSSQRDEVWSDVKVTKETVYAYE
jgi:hypothetical protein